MIKSDLSSSHKNAYNDIKPKLLVKYEKSNYIILPILIFK